MGLPSKPRLVGRSNYPATPWSQAWSDGYVVRKAISVIGKPHVVQDILTKYDPAKIINCLADIDWTTIDVVRIGTQHSTSDPIILWVGVVPGSLSWHKGVEVTYRCRSVLLKAGLDIHCEIRESIVKRTASSSVPVLLLEEGIEPSLSATLGGQAIAAERSPTREGTLGLYLSVGSVQCALVSRHVITGDDDDYNSLSGQHVIMPGQITYEAISNQQKENLAAYTTQDDKEDYLKLGIYLRQLEELSSRRIGHILFSPPRIPIPRPDHSNDHWLPDYAVIALDKGRLSGSLSNTVQVHITPRQLRLMQQYHPGRKQAATKPLHLQGTFTPGDHRVVGKYGKSTELT